MAPLMILKRARSEVVASVAVGLLRPGLWLRAGVVVKVPLHRRDRSGRPSAVFASLLHGPMVDQGILGVWALGGEIESIWSLNGAACEFSRWPLPHGDGGGATTTAALIMGYPEVIAAELGALSLERRVSLWS